MQTIVVVTRANDWPDSMPDVRVVTARAYLSDPEWTGTRRVKVFNLCRSYKYQSYGYYVSLLAEARGHKVLPRVMTLRDLRTPAIVRSAGDELASQIHSSLKTIASDKFELSIYFGKNLAKRHDRLASSLFRLFPAPLLRASFVTTRAGEWMLRDVNAIPTSAIPDHHRDFAIGAARDYFSKRRHSERKAVPSRFDLAILYNPQDPTSPSTERAIRRFEKTAENIGIACERIGRGDYGRLSEFDALFIRETTAVNHHTYRFSRRAAAEGLVVIDDPQSILRCTNKVYLAELLSRHNIPTPRTGILHKDNLQQVLADIGLPIILKQPDSSSSLGVHKADTAEEAHALSKLLFETSDLLIAQEFMPTDYDWRIGILDGVAMYASRYFMAKKHWQIVKWGKDAKAQRYGAWETIAIEDAPKKCVSLALKAAAPIGNGFYGVDLKQVRGKWYVIEVNDNPSVEDGVEDLILGDELYQRVLDVFLKRIEARKDGKAAK